MGEIGSLPVPPLHIPQQPEIVLALHFGQVERDREELLHELHHLLIGQPDFRQGINAMPAKVLVSTENMSYADWLEYRKQGIGGSGASMNFHLNVLPPMRTAI